MWPRPSAPSSGSPAAAARPLTPAVLGGIGGFGGLFRFDPTTHPDPVLVSSTDGVGTKLKVARRRSAGTTRSASTWSTPA